MWRSDDDDHQLVAAVYDNDENSFATGGPSGSQSLGKTGAFLSVGHSATELNNFYNCLNDGFALGTLRPASRTLRTSTK